MGRTERGRDGRVNGNAVEHGYFGEHFGGFLVKIPEDDPRCGVA